MSKEILISRTLSKKLKINVGDKIDAFFDSNLRGRVPFTRRFIVSGIFNSGFPDIDDNLIYGDIGHLQKINKWEKNQIGAYEVFVKDFNQIEETSNEIYNSLPSELNSIPITNNTQVYLIG